MRPYPRHGYGCHSGTLLHHPARTTAICTSATTKPDMTHGMIETLIAVLATAFVVLVMAGNLLLT